MLDCLLDIMGFQGLDYASSSYGFLLGVNLFDLTTKILSQNLPEIQKRALKAAYGKIKGRAIRLLASYKPLDLEKPFRRLGLSPGDAVIMHSSFNLFTGFQGSPKNVIDCLLNVLGPEGHLFMMSLAYTGSSHDYLLAGNPFDVRLTGSRMGIISEAFRRREHVLRSANPLHPVLAWGPQARWVVSGHDQLLYSCGPGSPFEKMLELNTKMLFFDVGFEYCTFEHYLEDRFKDSSPLPVYKPDLFDVTWFDEEGKKKSMKTYVFEPESSQRRNSSVLKKALLQAGFLKQDRIGNTTLMIVSMADALKCAARLVDQGTHFYRG